MLGGKGRISADTCGYCLCEKQLTIGSYIFAHSRALHPHHNTRWHQVRLQLDTTGKTPIFKMDEQEGNVVTMSYDLLLQLVTLGFHVSDELEADCRAVIGIGIDLSQSVFPGAVRVLLEAVEKVCETVWFVLRGEVGSCFTSEMMYNLCTCS